MKIRRRASNPKLVELSQLPVFSGLNGKQLSWMASNLDEGTLQAGERFLTAGHYNDTFWIIIEGELELTMGGRVHETLHSGDIIGLPSMFTGRASMADGVAKTPVRALVASHAQFNALLADREVEIRFKAAVFDRMRDELFQLTAPAADAARPKRATAKEKA
ncbi:MAG TPA: cyclic nucleotide-binding domain-containing protein [Candidatus Dormibacteraeota bacterium]|nr:cyclic nucleotide-binding domain-containing protein [Candidatus Dormibacteraeota bacterium]